ARDGSVAGAQPLRCKDVGLLAAGVADEGDKRGAVGVVFEPLDDGRSVILVALEIDDPVAPFMAAAAPAHRRAAGVVAPALLPEPLGQHLDGLPLPQLAAVDENEVALRRGRRIEGFQRHYLMPWASITCLDVD